MCPPSETRGRQAILIARLGLGNRKGRRQGCEGPGWRCTAPAHAQADRQRSEANLSASVDELAWRPMPATLEAGRSSPARLWWWSGEGRSRSDRRLALTHRSSMRPPAGAGLRAGKKCLCGEAAWLPEVFPSPPDSLSNRHLPPTPLFFPPFLAIMSTAEDVYEGAMCVLAPSRRATLARRSHAVATTGRRCSGPASTARTRGLTGALFPPFLPCSSSAVSTLVPRESFVCTVAGFLPRRSTP